MLDNPEVRFWINPQFRAALESLGPGPGPTDFSFNDLLILIKFYLDKKTEEMVDLRNPNIYILGSDVWKYSFLVKAFTLDQLPDLLNLKAQMVFVTLRRDPHRGVEFAVIIFE